jgi:hypothetical protein
MVQTVTVPSFQTRTVRIRPAAGAAMVPFEEARRTLVPPKWPLYERGSDDDPPARLGYIEVRYVYMAPRLLGIAVEL